MKTSVHWLLLARIDFEEILLARRELSVQSARHLRAALLAGIERLRDHPDLGRELDFGGPPGVYRRLVVGSHLIDYRHAEDGVTILGIRDRRTGERRPRL